MNLPTASFLLLAARSAFSSFLIVVVERHPRGRRSGLVPTPALGMAIGSRHHFTQVAGDVVKVARGDFLRGGVGVVIAAALRF